METIRYSAKPLLDGLPFLERESFSPREMEILEEDVSNSKRFLEWLVLVPGFKEKFVADPEAAVESHGLRVNAMEMFYLFDPERAKSIFGAEAPIPDSVLNYGRFVQNKIYYRDQLQKEGCVPENKRFAKWRLRQVNRCWGEFGGANASMIHTPLAYELSLGCSVGCAFCGLSAGRLQSLFRYTEENAQLWREVLSINKEIIGAGGRDAPCYYATEPLDNPDYERLVEDFIAINDALPQITTAVPLRDTARMHAMLGQLEAQRRNFYRFSVRSLEELLAIFREFTPRELLLVELLPQYPEAPSASFARVGRAMENADYADADEAGCRDFAQTIACISGFVVNMAEKSIRLITPTNASPSHPTGEYVLARAHFTNAADYREKLEAMIRERMNLRVEREKPLRAYPYFRIAEEDGKECLKSRAGYTFRFETGKEEALWFKSLCALLLEGRCSREELVQKLMEEHGADPLYSYWGINQLWNKGVILDERLMES